MSFIDLGQEFADTKEPQVAPEGREYDLVVEAVDEEKDEGAKKHNLRLRIAIEAGKDEGPYTPIFHYCGIPNKKWDAEKDKEKGHEAGTTSRTKMLMLKRVMYLFGLDIDGATGISPKDLIGARARAGLGQSTYQNRVSNTINLPRLPETS